jgi:hypothetical protein
MKTLLNNTERCYTMLNVAEQYETLLNGNRVNQIARNAEHCLLVYFSTARMSFVTKGDLLAPLTCRINTAPLYICMHRNENT